MKYRREKPKKTYIIKIERDGRCEINYNETILSRRKKDNLAIINNREREQN